MNNIPTHHCTGYFCTTCHPERTNFQPLETVFVPNKNPSIPHKCPVCEGRGFVRQNFYTMSESSSDSGNIPCRSCVQGIIYV